MCHNCENGEESDFSESDHSPPEAANNVAVVKGGSKTFLVRF